MAVAKVISIEITDYATRICEVSYDKKVATVYNSVVFDNPDNAVEDGYVINKDAYLNEFRKHLKDSKIKTKDAVFVMASNKVLSRDITIPEMKERLIASYIDGEKKDYFPMDISEHKVSYCIAGKDPAKKEIKLIVYAAPLNLIKNYKLLAKELDLKIIKIDYSGNAEYTYLHNNHQAAKLDFYLEINEGNTMFTILENGKFSLQRNMNFGTKALVEHLIDEAYYGEISKEEAIAKLATDDILYSSYSEMMEYMPQDAEDARKYEFRKRITEAIRPLIAGFSRVMDYYATKNKDAKVSDIYIGSCGCKIKGLDTLIMSEFEGLSIKYLTTLPNIKFQKDDFYMTNRSTEFMTCIGAAYSGVNFDIVDESEEKKSTTAFGLTALIIGVAGSVAIVGFAFINYTLANSKQKSLNSKIASMAQYQQLKDDRERFVAEFEELTVFDEGNDTTNTTWNKLLEELEIKIPSRTTVTSVTSNETGLTLVVTVPSKDVAAKLLVQLNQMEAFESVIVNSITESNQEEANPLVAFTVQCNYKQPEEPENPNAEAADNTEESGTEDANGGEADE